MRHIVLCSLFLILISAVGAVAQQALTPGSPCLAYWETNKFYYVGTVVAADNTVKGGGYLVIFADGDQALVPSARVRPLAIKVGSKVNALWTDKNFYPGTVARILGNALYINFDDGDKGWTSWAGIAVKPD